MLSGPERKMRRSKPIRANEKRKPKPEISSESLTGSTDLDQAKNYRLTIEQTNRIRYLLASWRSSQGELKSLIHHRKSSADRRYRAQTESIAEHGRPAGLSTAVDVITSEGRIDEQLASLTKPVHRKNPEYGRDGQAEPAVSYTSRRNHHDGASTTRSDRVAPAGARKLKKQSDRGGEELRHARQELITPGRPDRGFGHGEPSLPAEELIEMRETETPACIA